MAANTHLSADPEAAIEHYLNEGWNGTGWPPYTLLTIGECAFHEQFTARGHRHPDGPENAQQYRELVLDRARQRWMQGYYADPFTATPRRRPDVQAPMRRAA